MFDNNEDDGPNTYKLSSGLKLGIQTGLTLHKAEMKKIENMINSSNHILTDNGPVFAASFLMREDLIEGPEYDTEYINKFLAGVAKATEEVALYSGRNDMQESKEKIRELTTEWTPGVDPDEFFAELQSSKSFIENALKAVEEEYKKIFDRQIQFINLENHQD